MEPENHMNYTIPVTGSLIGRCLITTVELALSRPKRGNLNRLLGGRRELHGGIVESSAETSLRIILTCTHKFLDRIQRPDGCWTASSLKTLELIRHTHFPGSVILGDQAL